MIFEMGFPAMADDAVAVWRCGPRTEVAHRAAPAPERIAIVPLQSFVFAYFSVELRQLSMPHRA